MKYRYIEFKDRLTYGRETDGKLWLVGDPSEELLNVLDLERHNEYQDESGKKYCNTLVLSAAKKSRLLRLD